MQWSRPRVISSELDQSYNPQLAVDSTGTDHVVWAGRAVGTKKEIQAIFYTRKEGDTWIEPVRILVSSTGRGSEYPRVIIDNRSGLIHVFFFSVRTGAFGPLYHSWAPIQEAQRARSWRKPYIIAEGTYRHDVLFDGRGRLHLVFASVTDKRGICHQVSEDNLDTWTKATCFSSGNLREDEAEVKPRLAIDSRDNLHVVWNLDDYSPASKLRYEGRAIYYARSSDYGSTWTNLSRIDVVDGRPDDYTEAKDGMQPEWPMIEVDKDDNVHIVWVGNPDMQRYHTWSSDGGLTWHERELVFNAKGYNGWMGLAVDSSGMLHYMSASIGGVRYSNWKNGRWATPITLEGAGPDPHFIDLAVALGNEIHAVWVTEFFTPAKVMYSVLRTDGPRDTPQPIPTFPRSRTSRLGDNATVSALALFLGALAMAALASAAFSRLRRS